LTRLCNS